MGRVLEKELSISWMGNSSGDPPDPFFFWFCFQLASLLLALVDIYRNLPSSNYPWRMGNPKAAFSHQNLFPPLNSWRVRCDQAYQMCHSGGMVKTCRHSEVIPYGCTGGPRGYSSQCQGQQTKHVTKGVLRTQGSSMMAFWAVWSLGLHLCLSPFYEPESPAFLVILWTASLITAPTKILPINSSLL